MTYTFPRKRWENHLYSFTFLELVQHVHHEHGLANPFCQVLFLLFQGDVLPVAFNHIQDISSELFQLFRLGNKFRYWSRKSLRSMSTCLRPIVGNE